MKKDSQTENFISGTVNIFLALAFVTVIPLIVNTHIFIPTIVYQLLGGITLLASAIFYYVSSRFYKHQIMVIASVFLIFSIFQLTSATTTIATPLKLAPLIIGAGIFWLSGYDKKELS